MIVVETLYPIPRSSATQAAEPSTLLLARISIIVGRSAFQANAYTMHGQIASLTVHGIAIRCAGRRSQAQARTAKLEQSSGNKGIGGVGLQ